MCSFFLTPWTNCENYIGKRNTVICKPHEYVRPKAGSLLGVLPSLFIAIRDATCKRVYDSQITTLSGFLRPSRPMNQPYPQNLPYSQEWLNQPWGLAARLLTEVWNLGYLGALALGRVPPITWSPPNQNGIGIELQRLGEGAHGQVAKLKLRYQEWVSALEKRVIDTLGPFSQLFRSG
jgi:hypothetical protein